MINIKIMAACIEFSTFLDLKYRSLLDIRRTIFSRNKSFPPRFSAQIGVGLIAEYLRTPNLRLKREYKY